MSEAREWVQIGMLAHVVDYVCHADLVTRCCERTTETPTQQVPKNCALCAACYEADREGK